MTPSRRLSVHQKLQGFAERQAEREGKRRDRGSSLKLTPSPQSQFKLTPLPVHSPYLIARGRRAEATFETPRTHESHVEIREARKGASL